jgi:hypothetical protein
MEENSMSKVIHKKHHSESRPLHTDLGAHRSYFGPCSLYHAQSGRTFHFSSRHPKTHPERDTRTGGDYIVMGLFVAWFILVALMISEMRHLQVINHSHLAGPLIASLRL